MDATVGYVPRDVLQLPIPLRNNVGHVDDPVTTSNPEAQAYYNQGVACLHNYVWIDAAKAQEEFATAKKLWVHADPELPELSQINATLQARSK